MKVSKGQKSGILSCLQLTAVSCGSFCSLDGVVSMLYVVRSVAICFGFVGYLAVISEFDFISIMCST